MIKMTKPQEAFLQQRAQQKLVAWCDLVLMTGETKGCLALHTNDPYVRYAADRRSPWISEKSTGDTISEFRILSAGWAAATSFLKR